MNPCGFVLFLMLTASLPLGAQKRVSVDVTVQQVHDGKKTSGKRSIWCSRDGSMVVRYQTAAVGASKEKVYYMVSNRQDGVQVYNPATNETFKDTRDLLSASDELLKIFLDHRADDMGLGTYGYKLAATEREGKYIKKRFEAGQKGARCTAVEIVFDNYVPIYCAYKDKKGDIITKVYYSSYNRGDRFVFPMRVTEITYNGSQDSTVRLDVYSNLRVDAEDDMFNFRIPPAAKVVDAKSRR